MRVLSFVKAKGMAYSRRHRATARISTESACICTGSAKLDPAGEAGGIEGRCSMAIGGAQRRTTATTTTTTRNRIAASSSSQCPYRTHCVSHMSSRQFASECNSRKTESCRWVGGNVCGRSVGQKPLTPHVFSVF